MGKLKHVQRIQSVSGICVGLVIVILLGAGCPQLQPDTIPPGNVTGFSAESGQGSVGLTWANPDAEDFSGVRIRRSVDDYPATEDEGETVCEGPGEQFTDDGVENGVLYYYTHGIFVR